MGVFELKCRGPGGASFGCGGGASDHFPPLLGHRLSLAVAIATRAAPSTSASVAGTSRLSSSPTWLIAVLVGVGVPAITTAISASTSIAAPWASTAGSDTGEAGI